MTLKDKLKSYNFWISLASAIILILTILGEKFNFDIDSNLILDLSTALCSIFVVLGIISVPKQKNSDSNSMPTDSNKNLSDTISNDIKENISSLINQSPLSVTINEILNGFIELKENVSSLFNKEEIPNEEHLSDVEGNKNQLNNNESLKETNETPQIENQPVINQEIANGFKVENEYTQPSNTLNLESNISIETYQN